MFKLQSCVINTEMQGNNKIEPGRCTPTDETPKDLPPPYLPLPSAPPVSPPISATPVTRFPTGNNTITSIIPRLQHNDFHNSERFRLYPYLPGSDVTDGYIRSDVPHPQPYSLSITRGSYCVTTPVVLQPNLGVTINQQAHPGAYLQPQVNQTPAISYVTVRITEAKLLEMCPYAQRVMCPYCNQVVKTFTTYSSGMLTHLVAVSACALTACLCSWVPYFVNKLKDVEHYCPQCARVLGRYRRLGII